MVKKISKFDVTMSSLIECVANSVTAWKPAEAKKEITYSAALAEYLREACPTDTRIETEYRHGGTTADVWLSWTGLMLKGKIFFEVKRNLDKKTDYDRLIGQIKALKPRNNKVIVVLIGETSKELLGRLREHYKDILDQDSLLSVEIPSLKIITVTPSTG